MARTTVAQCINNVEARVTSLESTMNSVLDRITALENTKANVVTVSKQKKTSTQSTSEKPKRASQKSENPWSEQQMAAYKANIKQYEKKYYDGLHSALKSWGLKLTPKHCGRIFHNGEVLTDANGVQHTVGSFYEWEGYKKLVASINAMAK